MEKLCYKTFVFPNNPHTYREECTREPRYERVDGVDTFQGMGPLQRVITGEGRMFGENAFGNFQELVRLMEESTPGNLIHPVWGTRYGYLTGLDMTQEPRENCVDYRFQFRQADGDGVIAK